MVNNQMGIGIRANVIDLLHFIVVQCTLYMDWCEYFLKEYEMSFK